jgi:RluA family pseudouridine synthase
MKTAELLERLLHRDGLMLVIDKPAGIAVHAKPGSAPAAAGRQEAGDHLERHFHALRFGLPRDPALAHRLDRDTSGCLILGRHPKALRRLGLLFQQGRIEKTYWAVVLGHIEADEGMIDAPLAKINDRLRGWRMVVAREGQAAQTFWRVRGRAETERTGRVSFVELRPQTGRTHQIRVHMQHLGFPLLGDPLYTSPDALPAPASQPALPMHLHARRLVVPLQASKPPVEVTAPLPPHMRAALASCGWSEAFEIGT